VLQDLNQTHLQEELRAVRKELQKSQTFFLEQEQINGRYVGVGWGEKGVMKSKKNATYASTPVDCESVNASASIHSLGLVLQPTRPNMVLCKHTVLHSV
jgi:hypothetical protein